MRIAVGIALFVATISGLCLADPVADDTKPMTAGTHHLKFAFKYDGKIEIMTYGLYLPPNAEKVFAEGGKLPMVVYMVGAGSRGKTADKLHREGPLGNIKRSESFAKTVDYAVLVPQVAQRGRWENARMGTFVAEATRRVIERWPIDPDRVHLIGSSMGGEGAWHAGLAGGRIYTTVTSVAGRGHPDPKAVAEALKDSTVLIIVGSGDEDFTTGSKRMANALTRVGADVTLIVVPGHGHGVGRFYNNQPRFYEWALKHQRGAPLPADRADHDTILNWAVNPPGDQTYQKFSDKLQEQFSEFRPYWYIELCGMADEAGLHERTARQQERVRHPTAE
jgi:dienelactone hydrolase